MWEFVKKQWNEEKQIIECDKVHLCISILNTTNSLIGKPEERTAFEYNINILIIS